MFVKYRFFKRRINTCIINIIGMLNNTKTRYSNLAKRRIYIEIKTPSPQTEEIMFRNLFFVLIKGKIKKAIINIIIKIAAQVTGIQNSCLSIL